MRVVVYANDQVGSSMAGPAIRSFNFARELGRTFDVTLMAPQEPDIDLEGVRLLGSGNRSAEELGAALAEYDAVVTQFLPIPAVERLQREGTRVVYDLYIPFVERLGFLDDADSNNGRSTELFARYSRLVQRYALATGSAFICASERQRDLWLGMLASIGRIGADVFRADPTLRGLIDVVPFGLPPERPIRGTPVVKGVHPGIGHHDRLLLWAGGIWNWLDPLTPIRAVAKIARRRDDVKLLFLGLTRPVPAGETSVASEAVKLARELGVLDRAVFFNPGWVAYDERQAFLLEADLGICAHFDSLETRFAFRTRLLDHFWAGLPTVTTVGDVLADVVEARGLGRTFGYEDVEACEQAIETVLVGDRPEDGLFASVQRELAWPKVVEPLIRIAGASPPGRPSARALRAEERLLRAKIALSLGGPSAVLTRKLRRMAPRRG
jgi:glycosyltransferase involved in cell wall biosynthesis